MRLDLVLRQAVIGTSLWDAPLCWDKKRYSPSCQAVAADAP
jgi:hypothetical protein